MEKGEETVVKLQIKKAIKEEISKKLSGETQTLLDLLDKLKALRSKITYRDDIERFVEFEISLRTKIKALEMILGYIEKEI